MSRLLPCSRSELYVKHKHIKIKRTPTNYTRCPFAFFSGAVKALRSPRHNSPSQPLNPTISPNSNLTVDNSSTSPIPAPQVLPLLLLPPSSPPPGPSPTSPNPSTKLSPTSTHTQNSSLTVSTPKSPKSNGQTTHPQTFPALQKKNLGRSRLNYV